MKDTPYRQWKKRHKLSIEEASDILNLTPKSINEINSKGLFTKNHKKIMDLYDTVSVQKQRIESLTSKLIDQL